ncbi:hypothetical protein L486_04314 [Kwoniella mangroviensis CBS 10435]|uniref:Uncharacterized protein n=1 Tax=Kwoniella mangroviensis CBS 10435 TaxID=1331196 RepID=A0A1B9IRY7_9TREE|nr:hypothetical protein L486_04314 [Kwoniella mangroviensis CBS 10435]
MDVLFAQESIFVHRQQKMLESLEKANPEVYHSMETGKAQVTEHVEIKQEKVVVIDSVPTEERH